MVSGGKLGRIAAAVAAVLFSVAGQAQPREQAGVFVTLGTQGGPIPNARRSQPANVLLHAGEAMLIDVGDGAAGQLARAGTPLPAVRNVFISHLHFDHTGGLAGILGLRYAINMPGVLTVYGPPGTKRLVDGIVASMQPTSEAGYGIPGAVRVPPESTVRVVELKGGDRIRVGDVTVTTAANTHYSFAAGSPEAERFRSLSFRFDLPGRAIVYTGDTGPSAAVERLAKGADLLVSEMIDLPAVTALMKRQQAGMPQKMFDEMIRHLSDHHLTPEQVGELAARAGVKRVVVTHQVPGSQAPADIARYAAAIRRHFRGEVAFANDLDRF